MERERDGWRRVWRKKWRTKNSNTSYRYHSNSNHNNNFNQPFDHLLRHHPSDHRRATRVPRTSGLRESMDGEEKVFTVFVDNLPPTMTREWLWQLFKYEGYITNVYLSLKRRNNKPGSFGFVRFKFEDDAVNAIKRLNGLLVRGFHIHVTMSRYSSDVNPTLKRNQQPLNPNSKRLQTNPNMILVRKPVKERLVWRSAERDLRTYRDVVGDDQPFLGGIVGLDGAYICGQESFLDVEVATKKVQEVLVECKVLRLDDLSVLVMKDGTDVGILEEEVEKLQKCFDHVEVWHKNYILRFIRRFALFGVPLHLWSDVHIRRIARTLGRVVEVCFKEGNLASVEVVVIVEPSNYMNGVCNGRIEVKDALNSFTVLVSDVTKAAYSWCKSYISNPIDEQVPNSVTTLNLDNNIQQNVIKSPCAGRNTVVLPSSSGGSRIDEREKQDNEVCDSDFYCSSDDELLSGGSLPDTALDGLGDQTPSRGEEVCWTDGITKRSPTPVLFSLPKVSDDCDGGCSLKSLDVVSESFVADSIENVEADVVSSSLLHRGVDDDALVSPSMHGSLGANEVRDIGDVFETPIVHRSVRDDGLKELLEGDSKVNNATDFAQVSRRRGRPKKIIHSSVPIPVTSFGCADDESRKTWTVGKLIGLQCTEDSRVVKFLRRSARLQ